MKQRRISKELKVSQSTISKILSRYKITGSILPDPRGGFRNHNSLMRHSLSRLQQQQHQLQTEHLLQNQMTPLSMHSPGQTHQQQQQQQQFSASHLLQQQQQAVRQQVEASQMSMVMPQLFLQTPMNLASTFENAERSLLPISLRQVRRPPPPPPEPRSPSVTVSNPTTSANSDQHQQSNNRPNGRRKHAHVSPPESPPHQPSYPSFKHEYSSMTSTLSFHNNHGSSQSQQQFERLKLPMQWPTSASCSQAVASLFSSSYASNKNTTSPEPSRQQSTSYRVPKKRPNK